MDKSCTHAHLAQILHQLNAPKICQASLTQRCHLLFTKVSNISHKKTYRNIVAQFSTYFLKFSKNRKTYFCIAQFHFLILPVVSKEGTVCKFMKYFPFLPSTRMKLILNIEWDEIQICRQYFRWLGFTDNSS